MADDIHATEPATRQVLDDGRADSKLRRRLTGNETLLLAAAVGVLPVVCWPVFRPIYIGGHYGHGTNPLAVAMVLAFMFLAIRGVRRRIDEDCDAYPYLRKLIATIALAATAIGFCEQFGRGVRAESDDTRLRIAMTVVAICCVAFIDGRKWTSEAYPFRFGIVPKKRHEICAILAAIGVGLILLTWWF
jgi:hypothetical protein